MDFKHKNVLVCGMAISGVSAAKLLKRLGAVVTVFDIKEYEKVSVLADELESLGIATYLGKNPDGLVDKFELIVVSPGLPLDLPFLERANGLGIPIWGEIELAAVVCPAHIIAITGTNGKTTTTALAGEIFKRYKPTTQTVGNIGMPFTEKADTMVIGDFVVAEISSFQLETCHTFHPRACTVLNITPDHLNRHRTLENYIDVKKSIFKNQTPKDFSILNYDDPAVRAMALDTNGQIVYFSATEEVGCGVFVDSDGYIFASVNQIQERIIHAKGIGILGKHNLENALAAVALAVSLKVPVRIIREALAEFKGVEHRLEFVTEVNGVAFYNDSKATNTDSAIKALEALSRPILLIGGGYDKGADFSSWVKLFSGKVKHVAVLGEVADDMIKTMDAYSYTKYDKVNSLKAAVTLLWQKAEPGDCVLLSPACASWDMFDNFEQRGKLFKEFALEATKAGDK